MRGLTGILVSTDKEFANKLVAEPGATSARALPIILVFCVLVSTAAVAQIQEVQQPDSGTNVGAGTTVPQSTSPTPPQSTPQGEAISPQGNATDQSTVQPNASGQGGDSSVQGEAGQFVFRKQVEEVVLHATVVDQQNNLVPNLGRNGFQVYEDGKLQQITSFHQEHVPVALGILIDNSGSMLPKRAAVNQAALNLIHSTNPQDEIFVVNFGE